MLARRVPLQAGPQLSVRAWRLGTLGEPVGSLRTSGDSRTYAPGNVGAPLGPPWAPLQHARCWAPVSHQGKGGSGPYFGTALPANEEVTFGGAVVPAEPAPFAVLVAQAVSAASRLSKIMQSRAAPTPTRCRRDCWMIARTRRESIVLASSTRDTEQQT